MPRLDPPSRVDVGATLLVIAASAAVPLYGPVHRLLAAHPSIDDCTELVQRWVEHSARQRDPALSASAAVALRGRARERAFSIDRCTSELTRAEARCAMDAHNADEFERCVQ